MRLTCDGFPMPDLYLYHSRGKCGRRLRKVGFPSPEFLDTDAQTWTYGRSAVVLMEFSGTEADECALLVHEAVHVAEAWMRALGESDPAEEERAYVTQCVAATLIRAHVRWRRRHA